jgi:hypothetical protein
MKQMMDSFKAMIGLDMTLFAVLAIVWGAAAVVVPFVVIYALCSLGVPMSLTMFVLIVGGISMGCLRYWASEQKERKAIRAMFLKAATRQSW